MEYAAEYAQPEALRCFGASHKVRPSGESRLEAVSSNSKHSTFASSKMKFSAAEPNPPNACGQGKAKTTW